MATVDGVTTAPDAYGIVQGDGGSLDRMSGGSGNDKLQGQAEQNLYFGGGGNDTFIISANFANSAGAHQGQSTSFGDQFAVIYDFEGAGVNGGDFISLTGFKAGTLNLEHTGTSGTSGATLYYYSVEDMNGNVFNFMINSLTGNQLGAGDFNFY